MTYADLMSELIKRNLELELENRELRKELHKEKEAKPDKLTTS